VICLVVQKRLGEGNPAQLSDPKKRSVSVSGMEAVLAHAVVRPTSKVAQGTPDALAAKALGVHVLGTVGERPLARTLRARTEDGKQVALVVVADAATAEERDRFARSAENLRAAGDAVRGVQRVIAVAPSRDAFLADLWTTGTVADLSTLRWPLRRRLGFARSIVGALDALHGAGLVHGCLCAENVLLDDDLEPVLAEVGMVSVHALLSRGGDASTYATFTAPEVKAGQPVDARSDVYSAGRLVESFVPEKDVPQQVDDFVRRCLSPDPMDRYATAAELVAAIDSAVRRLPTGEGATRADGPSGPPQPLHEPRGKGPSTAKQGSAARVSTKPTERPIATGRRLWPAFVGIAIIAMAIGAAILLGK